MAWKVAVLLSPARAIQIRSEMRYGCNIIADAEIAL